MKTGGLWNSILKKFEQTKEEMLYLMSNEKNAAA